MFARSFETNNIVAHLRGVEWPVLGKDSSGGTSHVHTFLPAMRIEAVFRNTGIIFGLLPDQEKLIGKRDHTFVALLISCGI
jgi:hypothetical protein